MEDELPAQCLQVDRLDGWPYRCFGTGQNPAYRLTHRHHGLDLGVH